MNLQQVVRESPTTSHAPQRTRPAPPASLADEPASLRDQELLIPTEFQQQKVRLLGL
ncbi:hypothetical protein OG782_36880 [Streptomyces sp. NBC_00876]|uniref:hypothetical protein n=1 Tax=Streptomyces sp. NBC_00876 TaxID=2975853 RepID=UPI00386552CE|nr:hypothetical protein OG782_36880 [Streptomyces sp. NBC_00876]